MARLPDYRDLGERPDPRPSMGVTRLEPARDNLAGQISQAGNNLDDAALIVDRSNERQDRIAADAAMNSLQETRVNLQFDPKVGFQNIKAGGAVGEKFVKDYMGKFSDKSAGIAEGLQNDRQRALFKHREQVVSLQYRQSLMTHQARETELFNDQTADNTIQLGLRSMAQDPTNELAFQTSMVQIEATVDETIKRKGLPPESATALKAKYYDAAYSARILAVLDGVPGAVESNPYQAEKMFRQVQGKLGPHAQLQLGKQINAGVKDVQQRDGARAEVYGTGSVDARTVYPAIQGVSPLANIVMQMESGGRRYQTHDGYPAVQNKDGSHSTESSITVTDDRINGGKPTNIPSLWKQKRLSEGDAVKAAVESGKRFESFDSIESAVDAAKKRSAAGGALLTSPKGALGEMQVMPATADAPGLGVTPARDHSPEELARVGREYIGALTARYQEPALALAAYNAGPGQVDKWLEKYGDPRAGQITVDQWIAKIPFAETQKYVANGVRKVAETAGVNQPSLNQFKAEALPALLQRARTHAESLYPNDPRFVDGYVARTLGYANEVLNQQRARQEASADTLTQSLVGKTPITSMDQVMANPTLKQAFETSTPQAQLAYQTRLAQGDKKFDAESFQIYYGLLGSAGSDPQKFAQMDLSQWYGTIPDEKLVELSRYQKSISTNDAKQQAKDLNWQKVKSNVDDMLKPLKLGSTAKAGSSQSKTTDQFYGRLNEVVQQHFDAEGKWPDTQTTRKYAAGLLTEGVQKGGWFMDIFGGASKRNFEVDDQGTFQVPLPAIKSKERADLAQKYVRVWGRNPTDAELQQFYTAWRLSGEKK